MGHLNLAGADWRLIRSVLESSFDEPTLKALVTQELPRVAAAVVWMQGWSNVVFDAINKANQHGVLDRLLLAAQADRPYRPDLLGVALHLSRRPGWSQPIQANGLEVERALEKLTSPGNPFLDTTRLAQWLIRVERQVCQVRCRDEHGSGFLVAPDLVLTCYHVVEQHLQGSVPASEVQVRFDYRRSAAGVVPPYDSGTWLGIAPAWVIPNARYSQADLTLVGDPVPHELDFALLRLSQQVGRATPDGEEQPRGWVDLSKDPPLPEAESPMLIVQHPGNVNAPPPQLPLQIAFASPGFDFVDSTGTRIAYKPSTLPGSSGSPVFDRTLAAVALHHNRGQIHPSDVNLARNNRGIPLGKIRAVLEEPVRQLLIPPPQS